VEVHNGGNRRGQGTDFLPTVLREHEKVAREAARDGVDHVRYLLRLVKNSRTLNFTH